MNISGIIINDKEHKLSQYADGTLFLLDGTSKSLNATLNVLYEYSQFSGLKVNFEKTQGLTNIVQHLSKQGGNYHGGKQPLNY